MIKKCIYTWIMFFTLTGCSVLSANQQPTSTEVPSSTPVLTATSTITPSPVPTATRTPDPLANFKFSSPLQDMKINELSQIISSPFDMPNPGMDDHHHGVDFAYYSHGTHTQMKGLPIYSVLSGKVITVVKNLDPYGNMVIVETPIRSIPADLLNAMNPPAVSTPFAPNPRLTCPTVEPEFSLENSEKSLYLLYAHMNQTPLVEEGQQVASGQQLGEVGNTGMSGNPHLHFETRIGPSGAVFASLGHYATSASPEEMANYCLWRISGYFVMLNPMNLFNGWLASHPDQ
jgi:murein DD-endopeptidase MepM/ murein hydrolase activator NlpD